MYLIFDTETTGLPKNFRAPITDTDNWPRCVQIAWQLHDAQGVLLENQDFLVIPEGFNIPYEAEKIHGISTQLAEADGTSLLEVLEAFNEALAKTTFVVGQNLDFDLKIMGSEFYRMGIETSLLDLPVLDTCTETTATLCQLPGGKGGRFKLPTLTELHQHLFQTPFEEAHNATADVEATARCFFELIRKSIFTATELRTTPSYFTEFQTHNPNPIGGFGLKHVNLKTQSERLKSTVTSSNEKASTPIVHGVLDEVGFAHLHNHTQFSILESTLEVQQLVQMAAAMQMPAVAITDLGNMMGVFSFVQEVLAYNAKVAAENKALPEGATPKKTMVPIVGSEFNVCENHKDKTVKDDGYRVVLLAKNKAGYHNLVKLSSISHTEGSYYVPRIDKALLLEYKEHLIALSGSLLGEIPAKILNMGEHQAEEALLWWKNTFGPDFYLELMRHGLETENYVNKVLLDLSQKHDVKVVATNDVYFSKSEDAEAQDILICVKDGVNVSTPKGRGRGFRRGLENDQYYFKTQDEMKALFADIPQAIVNIQEIVDKVETYALKRDVLLPKFVIPDAFLNPEDELDNGVRGQGAYLRHLTWEGAKKRWTEITPEIEERIEFELNTIITAGYQGYFLIVRDLIAEARNMGVSVGPGRGSAAGSAVAYCLWITNIDPIKYDLLFERFLNPDRVSMPDIDIDFDDDGRQKVIDFVKNKYGQENVAQIITYGTMGAKSAIRDTGRVLELPLSQTDRLAKLVPSISLEHIVNDTEKGKLKIKELRQEEQEQVVEMRKIAQGEELEAFILQQASKVEGSVRNIGVHACGFIITPEKITNLVPIATAKDTDMNVTQFDNSVVESAGLLKMDFLGLKTLSLIKDTIEIVKGIHKIDLDPDAFPLDDEKTYELFQRGESIGIFQFESPGMRKSLKELKPTVFADLIAMVALYRPGPMDYIPLYIERKHGISKIEYDLPQMETILKETYGVTVYQEQVMRLSQILSDFTRGEADKLRKAMGKKQIEILNQLKPQFIEKGAKNGHPEDVLEKIWKDWEKFASYAFNKSHATCYAYISFQTAYLKAHYPAEFMAATLTHNMSEIKKLSFYMDECRHAGIPVLGPDVNESWYKFAVNKSGAIRFGMGGIKGVGQAAVESIVAERKKNGFFTNVFDFAKRVDLRSVNKRVFEGLAYAGGFDSFPLTHRAQYFALDDKAQTFIDRAIKYGNRIQESESSSQMSLFGGESIQTTLPEPEIPIAEEWGIMEKLSKEKEVVGIYISGHPLDDYKYEMKYFCNADLNILKEPTENLLNRDMSIGGILTSVQHKIAKNGKGWASFVLEDYVESHEFRIFGEDYLKYKHFFINNAFLYVRFTMKPSWKEGEFMTNFTGFQMLQDIMGNLSKRLTIHLNIDSLNKMTMDYLSELIKKHKGQKELHFIVYQVQDQIKLHMPSRKFKIEINQELLRELEDRGWGFEVK